MLLGMFKPRTRGFMTREISNLSQQLWSLTADLRPAAEGKPDDLHRARVYIASALASNETSVAARSASAVTQTPVELTQAHQQLLDTEIGRASCRERV